MRGDAGGGGYYCPLRFSGSALDGGEAFGSGDAESLAVGRVVHLGDVRRKLDGHGGDIGALGEDLEGHLAGYLAELEVVYGESGDAAAGAEVALTGDNGDPGGENDIGYALGVGGGGVVGGDVDDVGTVAGGLSYGGH